MHLASQKPLDFTQCQQAPPSPGPLTSELQWAEGCVGLQGEEVEGAIEPGSHNPGRDEHCQVIPPLVPSGPTTVGIAWALL